MPSSKDYVVKDIGLADWGRKEISIAETEMPGLMAVRAGVRQGAAAQGRPHRRLAAHDHPDRGADRDARGRSAPTCAGPPATSTRPRTMPPPPIAAGGTPVFAVKGESLKDYWDYTHRIFEWGDGGTPNMILDDGGDATLLIHLGAARREGRHQVPRRRHQRGGGGAVRLHQEAPQGEARLVRRERQDHPRRHRGDHHGRAPALRDAEEGHAAVARHQRQRQRHQVQVRQPLRLPRDRSSTASAAAPT